MNPFAPVVPKEGAAGSDKGKGKKGGKKMSPPHNHTECCSMMDIELDNSGLDSRWVTTLGLGSSSSSSSYPAASDCDAKPRGIFRDVNEGRTKVWEGQRGIVVSPIFPQGILKVSERVSVRRNMSSMR